MAKAVLVDRGPDDIGEKALVELAVDPVAGAGISGHPFLDAGEDAAGAAPQACQDQVGVAVPVPHQVEALVRSQPVVDSDPLLRREQGIGIAHQEPVDRGVACHQEAPHQPFHGDVTGHGDTGGAGRAQVCQGRFRHRVVVVKAAGPAGIDVAGDARVALGSHEIPRVGAPQAVGDDVAFGPRGIEGQRRRLGHGPVAGPGEGCRRLGLQGAPAEHDGFLAPLGAGQAARQAIHGVELAGLGFQQAAVGIGGTPDIAHLGQGEGVVFPSGNVVGPFPGDALAESRRAAGIAQHQHHGDQKVLVVGQAAFQAHAGVDAGDLRGDRRPDQSTVHQRDRNAPMAADIVVVAQKPVLQGLRRGSIAAAVRFDQFLEGLGGAEAALAGHVRRGGSMAIGPGAELVGCGGWAASSSLRSARSAALTKPWPVTRRSQAASQRS